ncbi:MAG: hypothetical protein IJ348_07230 [Alistipes sp.]|nr:hypothetical protein [Alistipes sp.]
MKKILLVLLAVVTFSPVFANGSSNSPVNIEMEAEASAVEILVRASDAVDDFCNYFGDSWVDVGLSLYCSFGGDIYICTIYKAVNVVCTGNDAIRLYLEGDINNALKRTLQGSSAIYKMLKVGEKKFKIVEDNSNMTPRSEWY